MKTLRILMVLIIVLSLGTYVSMKSAHGDEPDEPKGKGPPPKPVEVVAPLPLPVTCEVPEEAAKEPLQLSYEQTYGGVEDFVLGTYVVPSGKRLVIQFASVYVMFEDYYADEVASVAIETTVNDKTATYYLTPFKIFEADPQARDEKIYSGSQQIHVYGGSDTTVTIKGKVHSSCTNGTCAHSVTVSASISGYLEECVSSQAF